MSRSMIRRITLLNYMSHVRTVIEPAAGLTVLVGPNNSGKSAVVSALETLCYGSRGSYMVRHDAKEAQVIVETDDGHVVSWKRQKNSVIYNIDGREVSRVIPEDLHKVLRLPMVDAGDNDPFDIHFASQKSPIFLLNESESRAALFFASSSDAAVLLEMQKRHRAKVADKKQEKKRLEADLANLDSRLTTLEPAFILAGAMEDAQQKYDDLNQLAAKTESLENAHAQLETQMAEHQQNVERHERLRNLLALPKLDVVEPLERHVELLKLEGERSRQFAVHVSALKELAAPPSLSDMTPLAELSRSLQSIERDQGRLAVEAASLRALTPPPSMHNLAALARLTGDMEAALAEIVALEAARVEASAAMQTCQSALRRLEPATPSTTQPRFSRRVVLTLGGIACFLVVIFIGSRFIGPNPEDKDRQEARGVHKALVSPKKDEPEASEVRLPELKKIEETKVKRTKQVQQILHDADTANAKGKYLEAVLAYGQVALAFPEELANVEKPEIVRTKFMNALTNYQTEVERAILKASERKGDK
jgi:AAA domain-containing protein